MAEFIKRAAKTVWTGVIRTKPWLQHQKLDTKLNRCLNLFDLTMFGIGSMVGAGLFVITGTVVKNKTGPSIFIAYILAGVNALLNALCYAELGSRIPKAGSSYAYTYVAGGELLAFLTGWLVILEYVLSVASTARGWTSALNSLLNGSLYNATKTHLFYNYHPPSWLDDNPDLLAFFLVIILGAVICSGPKLSATFNNAIAVISVVMALFIGLLMLFYPRPQGQDFASATHGGFLPFSFLGVFGGAGTCFYAYVGFDAITLVAEEASNPKRDLPIAVAISVGVVITLMGLASFGLVWFQPWYLVDSKSAFTSAFMARGLQWAAIVAGVGMLISILSALFSSLFAMPKIAFAMAEDGLLPAWMGYIIPATRVPVVALAIFGTISALLALLFSLDVLADFLSIGTLLAFTIVCINVCILRFRNPEDMEDATTAAALDIKAEPGEDKEKEEMMKSLPNHEPLDETPQEVVGGLRVYFQKIPLLNRMKPGLAVTLALVLLTLTAALICCLLLLGFKYIFIIPQAWAIILFTLLLGILILTLLVLGAHKQVTFTDSFKVPFVPVLPTISILFNFALIVSLSPVTWIRVGVWTGLGLLLYFCYGLHFSKAGASREELHPLLPAASDEADETSVQEN